MNTRPVSFANGRCRCPRQTRSYSCQLLIQATVLSQATRFHMLCGVPDTSSSRKKHRLCLVFRNMKKWHSFSKQNRKHIMKALENFAVVFFSSWPLILNAAQHKITTMRVCESVLFFNFFVLKRTMKKHFVPKKCGFFGGP